MQPLGLVRIVVIAMIAVSVVAVVMVTIAVAHHVLTGTLVSAPEAFAIFLAETAINAGVAVFFTIRDIELTVVVVIAACALDSILKALTFGVAKFLGRGVPLPFLISRLRGAIGLGVGQAGNCSQCKRERRYCKPFELHLSKPPCVPDPKDVNEVRGVALREL
jgi:hypothetical protein